MGLSKTQLHNKVFVSIPKTVHLVVGQEFRMYYDNVLSRPDSRLWVGSGGSLAVRRYADYLSIRASEPITKEIKWVVYDNLFNVLERGTLTVIATTETIKTATALVIGDSTVTQSNAISQKLLDCFSQSKGSLTLLGTRGAAPALHEGRAGWSAKMYCTEASNGNISNPFYNNGFNFAHYMAQNSYTGVDVVIIQLGINDVFAMTYENFTATATLEYIQQMVSSILTYDSSIKVILNLLSVPNGNQAGFTEVYGTTQIDFVNLTNSIRMSRALIEHFTGNAAVTISPNNCVLDPLSDINDGVHPNLTGYGKLGQAIYETINGIIEGEEDTGEETSTLWDLVNRSGEQDKNYTASEAKTRLTDKYYYLEAYTGISQDPTHYTLDDYKATDTGLEFTVNGANGHSGSQLSAYGVTVPLDLEIGKTYTFKAQAGTTNSGVRLMTCAANGNKWTYSTNETICYNSTDLCTKVITPQAGMGYAINFSQKSAGVGIKNVFTNISLVENK